MNLKPPPRRLVMPPAYAPPVLPQPVAAPEAVQGVAPSYEVRLIDNVRMQSNAFVQVATSLRRWRACDVYVDTAPIAATIGTSQAGILSVFVYAVAGGLRSLVATGRYQTPTTIAEKLLYMPPAVWVAGARAVAERFEVWAHWSQQKFLAPPPPADPFRFTIACSDEAVDVPEDVGVILYSGSEKVATETSFFGGPPGLEILRVAGSNFAGGTPAAPVPRYLLGFNSSNQTIVAGSSPLFNFALGDKDGDGGVFELPPGLRVNNGLLCFPDPQAFSNSTIGGSSDCEVMAWVR